MIREEGQGKPASRWSQLEPEQPLEPAQNVTRSRWGNPESELAQPTESAPADPQVAPAEPPSASNGNAAPQEPSPFTVASAAPSVAFPLPQQQADTAAGKERQERSHTWLEQLEQSDTTPEQQKPARPRQARRLPRSRKARILSALLAAFALLVAAAIVVASIPGLREQALALLPGATPHPTQTPDQGTLIARCNVANAALEIKGHHHQMSKASDGFWSASVPLKAGGYDLSISAPDYSPASGHIQIEAQQTQAVTAFLALSPQLLATLPGPDHNQIKGQTLPQGVQTGDQYTNSQTADQPLQVTISYRVASLVDRPGPSLLEPGRVSTPPAWSLSGVVTPDILFTSASGAVVSEYHPGTLPADHFLLGLSVVFDSSGKPAFALANPAVLKVTRGDGKPLIGPGNVSPDPALLFALAQASLTQGQPSSDFSCIGLVDAVNGSNAQPNPEDGFMLSLNDSAHYFYRWGQLWTTNSAGQVLSPDLPQANQDTLILAQSVINAQQAGQPTGC